MINEKKLILLILVPLVFACSFEYDGNNELINSVIESQNYRGEIKDLIVYAIITIFFFFIAGYIGNKKRKK